MGSFRALVLAAPLVLLAGGPVTPAGAALAAGRENALTEGHVEIRFAGGAENLTSVTVRRGGREVNYDVRDLIGIDLIHFKTDFPSGRWVATATDAPVPSDPAARRGLLDRDTNLNTGAINPGGSRTPLTSDPVMNSPEDPARPNTPGLAVRFHPPVVNDAGPDLVIFEFQPVIQPEHGDPFHVSPLRFAPGLRSRTIGRWDFGTSSPEALTIAGFRLNSLQKPPASLDDFERSAFKSGTHWTVASKALAVGIDLSDLGYAPGASVEGLFLQDAADNGHQIDPVFIGGLPPVRK